MKIFKHFALLVGLGTVGFLALASCSAELPKGATAIQDFDVDKYAGRWYEVARFDYRFERNLNNVTATYSIKDNGNIEVKNRGYNYVKKEWKESIGEAKFFDKPDVARLKVLFFKPLWGAYNVIDIDDNYHYALIAGNNLDYLWILSREKTIPETYKQRFLKKAKELGYKTDELIWVEHE